MDKIPEEKSGQKLKPAPKEMGPLKETEWKDGEDSWVLLLDMKLYSKEVVVFQKHRSFNININPTYLSLILKKIGDIGFFFWL